MSDFSADPNGPQGTAAAGVGCFREGTPVWGNMGFVDVESLRPGDRVLVVDAGSGAEVFRPVTEVFERADTRIVALALESGEMVASHADQPYRLETGDVKPARAVREGDVLVTAGEGCARVAHNVQVELKSESPFHGIRVEGGVAVFVGRQGLMATIDGGAAVTSDRQAPAG